MKGSTKAALALLITAPLIGFALAEANASKGNARGEKDYLLILGYTLKNDEAEPILKMRCAKAAEYLAANKNTLAIACGGITKKNQTKTEAQVIKELLVANGVEEERIILEDKSRTTAENFFNAKKLMEKGDKASVALLSSDYHLLRAGLLAKKCGLYTQIVAAPTPEGMKIPCFIREFFALPLIYSNIKGAEKNG